MNQSEHPPHGTASQTDDNNVINIQLPYDLNAPTKPDLWSSNFHPISLHGSIKQITSNTKSIKDFLNFMAKYISNKKVNPYKANNLSDFDGIGNSIWNFISIFPLMKKSFALSNYQFHKKANRKLPLLKKSYHISKI